MFSPSVFCRSDQQTMPHIKYFTIIVIESKLNPTQVLFQCNVKRKIVTSLKQGRPFSIENEKKKVGSLLHLPKQEES